MGLFDDLKDESKLYAVNVVKCSACKILNTLPAEESLELKKVLADPQITKANVARILTANGYPIQPNTLTRHTRGECSGPR